MFLEEGGARVDCCCQEEGGGVVGVEGVGEGEIACLGLVSGFEGGKGRGGGLIYLRRRGGCGRGP